MTLLRSLLMLALLTACAPSPSDQTVASDSRPAAPPPSGAPEGMGSQPSEMVQIGFTSDARQDGLLTFAIDADEALEGTLLLANGTSADTTLALACVLDYRQIPCGEHGMGSTLTLKPQEERQISLQLADMAEGHHDLILMTFFDPDAVEQTADFRGSSRFRYAAHRVNLLVGAAAPPPQVSYQQVGTPNAMAAQGISTLSLTEVATADPMAPQWHEASIEPGQSHPYYLLWNNPHPHSQTIALLPFLNYQQVPLQPGETPPYYTLPPHSQAVLSGTLAITDSTPQEFVVVVVENPFLALAAQPQATTPRSFDSHSTERVLINPR